MATSLEQKLEHIVEAALERVNNRRRLAAGLGSDSTAKVLTTYLAESGMNNRELADKVEVHPTFIGKVASGKRGLSTVTLARMGQVFGDQFILDYVDAVKREIQA